MTQTVSAREVQEAGGLDKWAAKAAQTPPPPRPVAKNATSRKAPQARGRRPQNRLVGYDADRMNKTETRYAELLETQRRAGKVLFWRYESVKFRLADRTWYTPDFYIMRPDGSLEIHETKGYWEDDARVKIKATAEQFPEFLFVAVMEKAKKDGGGWSFERFRAWSAE